MLYKGKVHAEDIQVEGRKIPLYDIHKKLLLKNEKLMHLYSDAKIHAMDTEEVRCTIKVNKKYVDTWGIPWWAKNDTETTSAHTYTCNVAWPCHGRGVEEPEVYMVSLNSYTIEDQAALIAEFLAYTTCLNLLSPPMVLK